MNEIAPGNDIQIDIYDRSDRDDPERPSLLRDQAYTEIKERILRCDLAPGASVTVGSLANDLGLGRSPILNAIDRLVADGLVLTLPRKGIVVSSLGYDELIDIVEVRLLNEGQAARWAAEKATPKDIDYLRSLLDEAAEATEKENIEVSVRLDRAFHRGISAIAGNHVLEELLRGLHERSLRFWYVSLREPQHGARVHEEHLDILKAISAKDPDAAETALRSHISSFHQNVTMRSLRT